MRHSNNRTLLAQEAAKIIAEEGARDFLSAKRKAAARLGLPLKHLPTNREIDDALAAHQRLFRDADQVKWLQDLRRAALRAMDLLANFEPRVTGSVMGPTATAHSPAEIHVFADSAEEIQWLLLDLKLRYSQRDKRMRWRDGSVRMIPLYELEFHGRRVEILVFGVMDLRQAPMDPVDGRPVRRYRRRELECHIERAETRSFPRVGASKAAPI